MIDVERPTALLGGLTPARFMRRHWQKKPLLVRRALAAVVPPLSRRALFALAAREEVESRLVVFDGTRWSLRRGPLSRRALPPLATPNWTLLVQGLDLHVDAAHELLRRFRFVPDARVDDVMLSYASDGGGVGPHIDAYDVFLLQMSGQRRWRFGRCPDPVLRSDVPMKMLAHFEPSQSHLLDAGDMLYLPPGWAHEGTAVGGDCMTASVGFRAPTRGELARVLLDRLADALGQDDDDSPRYRDAAQPATSSPGALPCALQDFARQALQRALAEPGAVERALGEWLTEPKAQVWFEPRPGDADAGPGTGVVLDRRTRMAWAGSQLFVNGESFTVAGRDATVLRRLADARALSGPDRQRLGDAARASIAEWLAAGWLHAQRNEGDQGDG
jgi:50S ribosomal protein L16 3-hydroxylase